MSIPLDELRSIVGRWPPGELSK
jgi:hypothetical protein